MELKFTIPTVSIKVESNHIFNSSKDSCSIFLTKTNPTEAEILEFLLSLHFVLEIGINTFFRNYYGIYSNLDEFKHDYQIDQISFIDKIRFFLSSNRFSFQNGNEVKESNKKARQIISDIISFNRIRNMIAHGHSVSEISGEINKVSTLKKYLNYESAQEQIDKFKNIISNLNFFVDKLETYVSREQMQTLQRFFLNTSFLIKG